MGKKIKEAAVIHIPVEAEGNIYPENVTYYNDADGAVSNDTIIEDILKDVEYCLRISDPEIIIRAIFKEG